MKKWIALLGILTFLSGCAAQETLETVSDEILVPVMASPAHIRVELPGEAALPVVENDDGRIYLCEDYEILLQTMDAGDLEQTMQSLSGHGREELTVMETCLDGISRYEFVWASAGETGDRLGRGVILDDGNYHYCMTALWDADSMEKSQFSWNQVFDSFSLAEY